MSKTDRVIQLHRKYPGLTAAEIAERTGFLAAYVRAVGRRNDLALPVRFPKLQAAQRKIQAQRREMRT